MVVENDKATVDALCPVSHPNAALLARKCPQDTVNDGSVTSSP